MYEFTMYNTITGDYDIISGYSWDSAIKAAGIAELVANGTIVCVFREYVD